MHSTDGPEREPLLRPIDSKLGAQIARHLESQIQANGWADGHFLGHEEFLAKEYGVSRSVFREAIAIGEWEGFVESRRGREGGLYVNGLTTEATVSALRNYLFLTGASLQELLHARRLLDSYTLELAVRRMDAAQADGLKTLFAEQGPAESDRLHLSRLKRIVDKMSDIASLPPLRVFGGSLRHCYVDRLRVITDDDAGYLRASHDVALLRMQQIEAIIAGDLVAALDLQTRALDRWEAFQSSIKFSGLTGAQVVERLITSGALIYEFVKPVKKTEAVARAIAQRIMASGLEVGGKIGVETDLMRDLDVSRRVFREAIRILERFGIVEPGRGKHGGLGVGQPRPEELLRIMHRRLAPGYADQPHEYLALSRLLGEEAVRKATRRAARGEATLAPRIGAFRTALSNTGNNAASDQRSNSDFINLLADLCGDRVISCLLTVQHHVISSQTSAAPPIPGFMAAPRKLLELLDAIEAGDLYSAPRRMILLFDCCMTEKSLAAS